MSTDASDRGRKPPFAFLSRLVPLAAIAVLLFMLLPQLTEKPPEAGEALDIEPPLALIIYRSDYPSLDSLGNEGLKSFSRKEWDRAVCLLGEAHLHYSMMLRERMGSRYPNDLRFYLGLSYAYRGKFKEGIPLLEEETADDPIEPKYHWYLAHIYLAAEDTMKAREHFERIVKLGSLYTEETEDALRRIMSHDE
jgi:tetratricopeptide (TPR) repeat protein